MLRRRTIIRCRDTYVLGRRTFVVRLSTTPCADVAFLPIAFMTSSPSPKVRPHSPRAWLLAVRPKTLPAAIAPVLVAGAIAHRHGLWQWQPWALCLAFAALMQVASNFINDLFDHIKGRDTADRLGPERTCAQGWISPTAMRWGIGLVVGLACVVGLCLIPYGGWALVGLGVACVAFAFLYTTSLAQRGWGDALVIVFFGLVPVVATYYVQSPILLPPPSVWALGMACGLMVDTLLVVNNYRDRHTDASVGKRTLVVALGEVWGRRLYLLVGVLAVVSLTIVFVIEEAYPALLIPPCLYLVHRHTYRRLCHIGQGKALNALLGKAAQSIILFTLFTTLGLRL